MDDQKIVELYWERSETAVEETQKKYGRYCYSIANRILRSELDAEECVNDTYVRAWESMPPERPSVLSGFLGRITRNLALNRYDYNRAQKRDALSTVESEYWECMPSAEGSIEDEVALGRALDAFLAGLPSQTRIVFLRRYWYACTIREIAKSTALSESNVKVILHRTRKELKEYLQREGIGI